MAGMKQLNMVVVTIMALITVLNTGLVLNFFIASGQALAAAFNSQSIFLFAGAELAAVLLAYIVYKQKTSSAQL
ncbi:Uncharacterised protein [Halioglobus japonicus]|nr:Uncharacterised protein [Halioglobus japonicus]